MNANEADELPYLDLPAWPTGSDALSFKGLIAFLARDHFTGPSNSVKVMPGGFNALSIVWRRNFHPLFTWMRVNYKAVTDNLCVSLGQAFMSNGRQHLQKYTKSSNSLHHYLVDKGPKPRDACAHIWAICNLDNYVPRSIQILVKILEACSSCDTTQP